MVDAGSDPLRRGLRPESTRAEFARLRARLCELAARRGRDVDEVVDETIARLLREVETIETDDQLLERAAVFLRNAARRARHRREERLDLEEIEELPGHPDLAAAEIDSADLVAAP